MPLAPPVTIATLPSSLSGLDVDCDIVNGDLYQVFHEGLTEGGGGLSIVCDPSFLDNSNCPSAMIKIMLHYSNNYTNNCHEL